MIDQNGEPIIGASISVINGTSTLGTITDVNGAFSLTGVSKGAKIQAKFIGYTTAEQTWDGSPLTFTLHEETNELDEVVVVGYGVEKKVNVVGSISTVSAKKLENRSTPSVVNALTGQMPGVTVRQTTGSPGDDGGEIRVRGVGSFGATPSALILVDGIPGSLTNLNMEDIENISVLKDASSAAIYGSRAANGVILVTTKNGKEGRTHVNYSGYVGFSNATAIPEKVDTWEYAKLYNIANGSAVYSDEEIQKFRDGSDPDHYANSRYLDELFHTGVQTGHDISINGGNSKNQYMISFGYLYQDGIIKKNDYSRYNGRLNLVTQLWPRITLTSRVQGVYGVRNQPTTPYGKDSSGMNAIVSNSLRWPGTVPTVLSNGNYGAGEEGYGTSLYWLETPSFIKYDFHNYTVNERVDYRPIDDLVLSAIVAYNYTNTENKNFRSTYHTDVKSTTSNIITNSMTKTIYKTFQATADYNRAFGLNKVGLLLGYSWEQQDYRYVTATRSNLPSDDYPEIDTGDADTSGNSGGGNGWALQSLFGRLKYSFNERYLLDATFRYDGSSRFPKDNRYAFFPSVAVGWRMSEESFIKDNFMWINNLKLKASIGKLGNQEIGNYPYQSVYNIGYNYPFGSTLAQGVAITTAVDPTLHWEETRTTDVGIEGNLWNGLLSFDATYFYRKTSGILFSPSASVSSVFGFGVSQMNMGELENRGWEFSVNHHNTIGDFNYTVGANFSIINNKVLSLGLADVEQPNGLIGNGTYFLGYPMNIYYGYETDGVFLDQADIDAWVDQSAIARNSKPGDIRYVDLDGDGKVTATDRKVLGSRIPKYTFGLNLSAEYRGFDLSALFQGVAGVKGYLSGYAGYAFFGYGSIQRWQADGYFDPENPTRYPAYPRLELIQNSSNNTLTSSFWTRNASYLRIKNVQVGYSLPKSLLNKLRISGIRIYAQCENPYTFHNFPKGWDPEINTDGQYYPILRTYTFGLNLNF
ncbi:MAG: TonB-dependent receptor [Roseburia sp.]|nr:TonB-dependent receptor [Roseburia sp.]